MLQSRELMEEFRGLLNLEVPGKKLLNIVFFGLPEVEDCLALDEPLSQRVAVKYHLKSMTVDTTTSYIKHRLQVAGAGQNLFEDEVTPLVHRYAGGVPRLINTISDNCLFEAFLCKMKKVDNRIAHSVAGDLGLLQQPLSAMTQEQAQDELDEIDNMLDKLEQKQ